ncbi:hypothetical protein UFOVP860_46 [uncultured Caudovirales phage]|uniref:Uncharacterized protein n=1 Tax=uncultured Caudovirales phage TaxID=2100421 RepID=A0A6J5RFW5_9CAUD|nr:hypothetical protein UFOVP860_46 [uncultured Caudovirales phage]CAB4195899.1 hypothetical protein UFOVP1293_65 [uncultured Caudovirales phage]CAB4222616.1 hypothetical protein UFOVP1644_83 [uncultured Caudovirales phage]
MQTLTQTTYDNTDYAAAYAERNATHKAVLKRGLRRMTQVAVKGRTAGVKMRAGRRSAQIISHLKRMGG